MPTIPTLPPSGSTSWYAHYQAIDLSVRELQAAPSGGTVADATATTKGLIQLAGDLAGTSGAPAIGSLKITAAKMADASAVNRVLGDGAVTDAKVAAANKDGTAATPSMRTLGTGATQAAGGTHTHSGGTGGGTVTYDTAPAGMIFLIPKGTAWPTARPSTRGDIYFDFTGSGTAGTASSPESIMLDFDRWTILP